MAKDVPLTKGAFRIEAPYRGAVYLLHTQFHALVEGYDFKINALGDVELIKDIVDTSE